MNIFCRGGESKESKKELRRQAMLAAAHDLFVEKGYEATTLNDIVRRSGGSLATLYEFFENKPGLLRALVDERCDLISNTIDHAISSHQPPREALTEIASRMFDKILDPAATALFKAAIVQPELGRQLYEAGPAMGQAKVAEYLKMEVEEGAMTIDDPDFAARMFFQMMFGHYHQRLIFGMPLELDPEQRTRHFDRTLNAFFKIYDYVDARSYG